MSTSRSRLIKETDRILNKPVKVFHKTNGKIKREIVEKDSMNVFELVDAPSP